VTRSVRSSQRASEELAAAVRWYELQRADLGFEFLEAISAAVSLIEESPEIGSPIGEDPRTRRVLVARFPYQVIHRVRTTEIVLVAFAHSKRHPDYWKSRE